MRLSLHGLSVAIAVSAALASSPARSEAPLSSPKRVASAAQPLWPEGWPEGDLPAPQPTEERYSTGLMTAGIVLIPVSHVAFNIGALVLFTGGMAHCSCAVGMECDCGSRELRIGSSVMAASGLSLITGIVLTSVGARSVRLGSSARCWPLPSVAVGPGGASLSWRF